MSSSQRDHEAHRNGPLSTDQAPDPHVAAAIPLPSPALGHSTPEATSIPNDSTSPPPRLSSSSSSSSSGATAVVSPSSTPPHDDAEKKSPLSDSHDVDKSSDFTQTTKPASSSSPIAGMLRRLSSRTPAPAGASTGKTNADAGAEEDRDRSRMDSETSSLSSFQRAISRRSKHMEEGWSLESVMKDQADRFSRDGLPGRQLDVAWHDLSVRGVGADAVFAEDLGSMFNPLTKRKDEKRRQAIQRRAQVATSGSARVDASDEPSSTKKKESASGSGSSPAQFAQEKTQSESSSGQSKSKKKSKGSSSSSGLGKNEKYLLQGFTGCLKAGEMALVLGRPGAGCTTFLKAITNIRQGYAGVDGEVTYGTMDPKQAEQYRGQIIFVSEDEIHYPDLTVKETIDFALKMKTPAAKSRPDGVSRKEAEEHQRDTLLKTFGIEHTIDTKVGNESVRGVSGGERKRVTLAEALATRAAVLAFDQPTRGLDASTALEFTQALRTITDYTKTASFTTVYQAGNAITECFDKVLVIAAGHCIYWGPMNQARPYFESLGFLMPNSGANLSDYLTAVTVATERIVAEDKQGNVPNTPEEFAAVYRNSDIHRAMVREYEELMRDQNGRQRRTDEFRESVAMDKEKRVSKKSVYTTSLPTQVIAATRRQAALTWNDKASLVIKQAGCIIQSVVLGSLFYMLPDSTVGLFGKSGVLFLIILVGGALLALPEVTNSFRGRTILAKHKSFGLYRPSALILAQVVIDFLVVFIQVTVFSLPIYWMAGLRHTAGAYFFLWVLTYFTSLAELAFFRLCGFAFASFQAAGAVSGLLLGLQIITCGYLLPNSRLRPWIGWFKWLNPLFYALESAFINEFNGTEIPCTPPNLIPYGQGYPNSGDNVICTVAGAALGSNQVSGSTYLEAQFGYKMSHKWRNFGIIIVWWIGYVIFCCIAVERIKAAGSTKSFLLFRRPKDESDTQQDVEAAAAAANSANENEKTSSNASPPPVRSDHHDDMEIERTDTVFAWKNLNYTVKVRGGQRQLLNNVQGFTKPGSLVALMGASGAGKTTLLDVLGARKEDGKIEGDITVDGRPRGPSFQRTCGYVGQMDIHEPTQTIREAFLFSARLRQPAGTPESEIQSYVDKVIDVLELNDLADAVIGVPGAGLSVEQRKRCTIGVELVAKPRLIFLDEPTSGLDGQSAYQVLRFLKKLSAAGQSMLVTVHQPSAQLFDQFDQLLLLAKGGRVVFNGELGKHASNMKAYFAKHGAPIEDTANPAEAMIDIVSGARSKGRDWAQIWLESEEYQEITRQVNEVTEEASQSAPSFEEDGRYYASSLSTQLKLVTRRAWSAIVRTPEYSLGRIGLCVGSGLVTGLSFLQMPNNYNSVQNRLFAVFNAMFVAPGLFNIIQPRVIEQRTLYESREKGAKMYGWFPWVFSVIVTEIPLMLFSCILSWTTWYLITFPVGIMTNPQHAGAFFAEDVLYFLWIAGFAQFIAVLCPTAEAAALLNSVPLGLMAAFAGVLLPYPSIPSWWRYWVYYLDPWSYILGAKVFFVNWNVPIRCDSSELSIVNPTNGQTCGSYLQPFISQTGAGYVNNPDAYSQCEYCPYASGNEYLATLDITKSFTGWRNFGITAIWVLAFWGFTIAAMKRRSRKA